jgi:PAS domain S-box-containing protein
MTYGKKIDILENGTDIRERLQFEQLIVDLSARLINLPSEKLDGEIEHALKMVLEFFQVDRCALLRVQPGRDAWKITHLASSQFASPVPVDTVLPRSINPWAYDRLANRGEVVLFSKVDDMPDEARVDKQTWRDWGIRSNLVIPLFLDKTVVHIIAINAVQKERAWPEEFIPRLQLLGEIFVSALERRKAEQALRESEEQLNLAASAAEAGIWMIDVGTGGLWMTDKTREIFQFPPDEDLSFERFLAIVFPEDRESVRAALARCSETRELVRLEYRIVLPDGRLQWVVVRGRSFPATAEQPERVMGVVIDITRRKTAEIRIQKQMEEIQRLKDQLEQENIYLREEIKLKSVHEKIVSRSQAMKQVLAQVEQVARTDTTVFILGETGTGKELLAQAVHRLSSRAERSLVTVNCASLPPTLIESELFGREKGAYTGALTQMTGRFEIADGATMFLDEIGELPQDVQSKLLRVLEEGRFERLGSTSTKKVDVRVIAATNRNLAAEVGEDKFRKDLYYRLNVFPIAVPPLRERPEDIPLLVWTFVKQFEKQMGKRIDHIPRKNMEALLRYSWPGNARELKNVIERAMIVSSGKTLAVSVPRGISCETADGLTLEDIERRHIKDALEKCGWRLSGPEGAAVILGLKRTTLQSKMKKLGIRRPSA